MPFRVAGLFTSVFTEPGQYDGRTHVNLELPTWVLTQFIDPKSMLHTGIVAGDLFG